MKPPKVNPNHMDPEEYADLKAGIRAGRDMPQPLLVAFDTTDGLYEIVDGEHRWSAVGELIAEGVLAPTVTLPCVLRDQWSAEERAAWRLGLNKNRGAIRLKIARDVVRDLSDNGADPRLLTIAGYKADELLLDHAHLTDAALDVGKAGKDSAAGDEIPAGAAAKPFVLEVPFRTREELVRARRALLKASGPAKDLSTGLFAVLGDDVKSSAKGRARKET
jgi:hypothetical protein